jgi:hypothetical protein
LPISSAVEGGPGRELLVSAGTELPPLAVAHPASIVSASTNANRFMVLPSDAGICPGNARSGAWVPAWKFLERSEESDSSAEADSSNEDGDGVIEERTAQPAGAPLGAETTPV